mmetsp:Transcript_104470/g.239367  ORF Transcript_104470/g.239367 Transcript_104470/m.239367 type:complete len:167 (-) Transcript_104470:2024-2524(-)
MSEDPHILHALGQAVESKVRYFEEVELSAGGASWAAICCVGSRALYFLNSDWDKFLDTRSTLSYNHIEAVQVDTGSEDRAMILLSDDRDRYWAQAVQVIAAARDDLVENLAVAWQAHKMKAHRRFQSMPLAPVEFPEPRGPVSTWTAEPFFRLPQGCHQQVFCICA